MRALRQYGFIALFQIHPLVAAYVAAIWALIIMVRWVWRYYILVP